MLCLYNGFSLDPQVPPTHTSFLFLYSFCSFSSSLSCPWQMYSHLRTKKHGHHTLTQTVLNQLHVAHMLITSHWNKTNDFLPQIAVVQNGVLVASSCNIQHQNQTRDQWFIRLSVCCWPEADSQTQSTQPKERNSTSKCGVMVQHRSKNTYGESAEHMLILLSPLLSAMQQQWLKINWKPTLWMHVHHASAEYAAH